MKLTEIDVRLFKALKASNFGTDLADYLSRLSMHVCDARSWGKDDTKEVMIKVAEIIESEIRDKIVLQNKDKKTSKDDFS